MKSKSRHLTSASKTTSLASNVGHGSSTTYEPYESSDNDKCKRSNFETPCDKISLMNSSRNGFGLLNVSSSPVDRHWNCLKRMTQGLDDDCCGIKFLDTIFIDDNNFVDEDSNSTSLFELAKQDPLLIFFLNLIIFLFRIVFNFF